MRLLVLLILFVVIFSFGVVAQETEIESLQQQISALRAELQNQVREKQQLELENENLSRKKSGSSEFLFLSIFTNLILIVLVVIGFLPKKKKITQKSKPKSSLEEYMKGLLDKGYSYQDIKTFLMQSGWPENKIEKAYREIS